MLTQPYTVLRAALTQRFRKYYITRNETTAYDNGLNDDEITYELFYARLSSYTHEDLAELQEILTGLQELQQVDPTDEEISDYAYTAQSYVRVLERKMQNK